MRSLKELRLASRQRAKSARAMAAHAAFSDSPATLREALTAFPWRELRHALWVPAYLLCFVLLESLPDRGYWATQLPIDDAIPFCSWFVIPYCLWFFLMVLTGVHTLFCDRPAFHRYMKFLSFTFFASVILWIFFPNGQDLRPAQPEGLFAPVVALIYQADTNTNVFPSLHVVGAIGAALAMRDAFWQRNRRACYAVFVLSGLICLSTLLIKQHSVLDVVGGLALAAIAGFVLYRKRRENSD